MKHTSDLLVTKIFSFCLKNSRTVDEISSRIYKNGYAKNQIRVFQVLEALIKEGIVAPKVSNGTLRFQVDRDFVKEIVG